MSPEALASAPGGRLPYMAWILQSRSRPPAPVAAMNDSVLAVIPARLASERLPEKPLQLIAGRPLIEWVWRRVSAMRLFGEVVVATEHPRVEAVCRGFGARVLLTDVSHPSGTDRVAEVASHPRYSGHDIIANIQGDEPLVEEDHLERAVSLVRDSGWDLATCAAPLGSPEAFRDPSVVKAARARNGRALYFSRAPIPHRRDGDPSPAMLGREPYLRHLGVYVYRRRALLEWVALPPSPLEELERLEQLRALEAGMSMGIAVVTRGEPGVDTAADLARMEGILSGTAGLTPSEAKGS